LLIFEEDTSTAENVSSNTVVYENINILLLNLSFRDILVKFILVQNFFCYTVLHNINTVYFEIDY